MAILRGPVGSPVLAHGLNLPVHHSLLARSHLSAIAMPRTLSSARRHAAVPFGANVSRTSVKRMRYRSADA